MATHYMHHQYRRQDGRWVQIWRRGEPPAANYPDQAARREGDRQTTTARMLAPARGCGVRTRTF